MEGVISYTYNILKKLSLYITDGRYKIDNNMVEKYELGKKYYADLLPGQWAVAHATDTK